VGSFSASKRRARLFAAAKKITCLGFRVLLNWQAYGTDGSSSGPAFASPGSLHLGIHLSLPNSIGLVFFNESEQRFGVGRHGLAPYSDFKHCVGDGFVAGEWQQIGVEIECGPQPRTGPDLARQNRVRLQWISRHVALGFDHGLLPSIRAAAERAREIPLDIFCLAAFFVRRGEPLALFLHQAVGADQFHRCSVEGRGSLIRRRPA
jgi:hypothetical protein